MLAPTFPPVSLSIFFLSMLTLYLNSGQKNKEGVHTQKTVHLQKLPAYSLCSSIWSLTCSFDNGINSSFACSQSRHLVGSKRYPVAPHDWHDGFATSNTDFQRDQPGSATEYLRITNPIDILVQCSFTQPAPIINTKLYVKMQWSNGIPVIYLGFSV